jgi:excisionase family DNA binding protein
MELLTTAEAAQKLRCSEKTVKKLAREGRIGSVWVTSRLRMFSEEQIREYVAGRIQEPKRIDKKAPTLAPCPRKGENSASSESEKKTARAAIRKELASWR